MKHFAKRTLSLVLILVLAMSFTITGFAVNLENNPSIILDGQTVSFTKIMPVLKNNRTYIPLNDIMDTIGAISDYNKKTNTVTVSYNRITFEFVVGKNSLAVRKDGSSEKIETSCASYIQNHQIMMPAVYLNKGLGFLIGWDNINKTVILINTDKLIQSYADKFKIMDQYLAYSQSFKSRNLAYTGNFALDLNIANSANGTKTPLQLTGTLNGVSHQQQSNMDLTISTNNLFSYLLSQYSSENDSDKKVLQALSDMKNIQFRTITNLDDGKIYLSSPIFSLLGMPNVKEGTWLSVNFNKSLQGAVPGMNFTQLLKSANSGSFADYLINAFSLQEIDEDSYNTIVTSMNLLENIYGDKSMKKMGNTYTSNYSSNENNVETTFNTTFTFYKNQVNSYNMDITIRDSATNNMTMQMNASQNYSNSKATVQLTVPDLLDYKLSFDMQYTNTSTLPAEAPPSGSDILPLM
ncbi:MAG: copper amine oxidase N-terminal domain-containing protein [Clostridiales bacterium]|nr:copper amine oxidase N-terminal domain-containing protein [Clostridiales bacterium]